MATKSTERARWLLRTLELERPLQIADIGARLINSNPTYGSMLRFDAAHLHAFEPEPEALENLRAAATENMTVYPYAVGRPGPATFYAHHIGGLSSVYRMYERAAHFLGRSVWVNRPVEEIDMTLVALDAVQGLPKLDMLKMDVQGAELDILRNGWNTLSDAVMIIPEVRFYRMYEHEPMWSEVDAELRSHGFELHRFLFQKSVVMPSSQKGRFNRRAGGGSQLLDGDAVYIRNLETPGTWDTEKLKMMALLADVVCGSHDLCAFCLDHLSKRRAVHRTAAEQYVDRIPDELRVDETEET